MSKAHKLYTNLGKARNFLYCTISLPLSEMSPERLAQTEESLRELGPMLEALEAEAHPLVLLEQKLTHARIVLAGD